MVLDNERCSQPDCKVHPGWTKKTSIARRNEQIRDDWSSGSWTLEELGYFWGLKPLVVSGIVQGVSKSSESDPAREVAHSL
jgi:hypothetical protein